MKNETILKKFQMNKKCNRLLLFFGIAVAVCAIYIFTKRNYIPAWAEWNEKELTVPCDEEGIGNTETVIKVKNKKLEVINSGKVTFESEKGFKVQDVLLSDLDGNGDIEMIVLLWKKGLYGKHRPFWVENDEKCYSQHIFLYDLNNDGSVKSKWGASKIGVSAKHIKLMEQKESIILVEDIDDKCTLWSWQGWGLKNIENEIKIVAFGDNLIHKEIYEYAIEHENGNFDFLYEPFRSEIQSADIAALNAETVLVDKESMIGGYPSFGSPIEVGEAIKNAGFDVASCANNHALDRGVQGIDTTVNFYENAGIACVGIQSSLDTEYRPYEIISRNGIKIALFSYTYGTNVGDAAEKYPNMIHYLPKEVSSEEDGESKEEKKIIDDLHSARNEADFVIVFAHWGEEYNKEITPYQKRMAKIFAKGGADVVIGSHPHVVQKTELMDRPDGGKMLTYYSLGNFRAYQGQSEDTKYGAEACFTIAHAFDGVAICSYETKDINAFWE